MHRRHFLKGLAGAALCPLCAKPARADAHWSYAGTTGPDKWGDLDTQYRACKDGTQQSPIDIRGAIRTRGPAFRRWRDGVSPRVTTIVNNGHTIQVNVAPGTFVGEADKNYQLEQFHFHHPSEHSVNGQLFAMEVHFVHTDGSDLFVLGVLMRAGTSNWAFRKLIEVMPTSAGEPVPVSGVSAGALGPERWDRYYRYSGSLTTPKCTETVAWMVFADPYEVAQSDITAFGELFPMNARPRQELNRRFILQEGNL